ncbi:hypothetical protein [Streptomyces zaomyceticus]|nr:hypothetical protein [Streptomyces zaomyceticus]
MAADTWASPWGFVLLAVTATGAGTLATTAVRRHARATADA